jgi:hypothetical protein
MHFFYHFFLQLTGAVADIVLAFVASYLMYILIERPAAGWIRAVIQFEPVVELVQDSGSCLILEPSEPIASEHSRLQSTANGVTATKGRGKKGPFFVHIILC